MSAIYLLRLYNGELLDETIRNIETPDLCKAQTSQQVLDNNLIYYQ